jgi:hypothetical protein
MTQEELAKHLQKLRDFYDEYLKHSQEIMKEAIKDNID